MNVVILYGAVEDDLAAASLHDILLRVLADSGHRAESVILHQLDIRPCIGCFGCWIQSPGLCLVEDDSREVARVLSQSDLVIYLTPVTFGGYSSQLKKALDRSIGIISPFFTKIAGETHHRQRYERYPSLLGLGLLPAPDPDSERIFGTLVGRNALNMHAPTHAAGVIHRELSPPEMREQVQALLQAVEVTR